MPINPISNFGPIGSTQSTQSSLGTLSVGAEYQGKILSFDAAGTAEVQIGDQVFGMKLPSNNVVGEVLHFRYLGNDPNPTFLLLNDTANPGLFENVVLSSTSMLITQFLDESYLQGSLSQVNVVTEPLLPNPLQTQLSAVQLQNAILFSGLFYESHIANLIKGQWSLSSLMKEPQNRSDFNASPVVARQLDFLENQSIVWGGAIWPGQLMAWKIGYDEQNNDQEDPGSEAAKNIYSEIEIDLPKLGKVKIHLKMAGQALSVYFKADQIKTENLLEHQMPSLKTILVERGQNLDAIAVVPNE